MQASVYSLHWNTSTFLIYNSQYIGLLLQHLVFFPYLAQNATLDLTGNVRLSLFVSIPPSPAVSLFFFLTLPACISSFPVCSLPPFPRALWFSPPSFYSQPPASFLSPPSLLLNETPPLPTPLTSSPLSTLGGCPFASHSHSDTHIYQRPVQAFLHGRDCAVIAAVKARRSAV